MAKELIDDGSLPSLREIASSIFTFLGNSGFGDGEEEQEEKSPGMNEGVQTPAWGHQSAFEENFGEVEGNVRISQIEKIIY
mgnify:CR=1 FL=1